MEKHFVEKYSGGYYFSSEDPNTIQGVGEDQGNGDNILFTYDEDDLEEPVKSMGVFLTKNLVFTREKLIEKLINYHAEYVGVHAAMTEITCDAIYEIDTHKDMLKILLEENKMDKDTYDKLIAYLEEKLRMQLVFLKDTDKISLVMYINNRKAKKKEK